MPMFYYYCTVLNVRIQKIEKIIQCLGNSLQLSVSTNTVGKAYEILLYQNDYILKYMSIMKLSYAYVVECLLERLE